MNILHRINIDKIERLAQEFRKGIELEKEADCFRRMTPLNIFPKGCCGDASDLLAQYYFEHNISCFRVCGIYRYNNYENSQSHAWIETDNNLIVDITADQFNNSSLFSNYCFLHAMSVKQMSFTNYSCKKSIIGKNISGYKGIMMIMEDYTICIVLL